METIAGLLSLAFGTKSWTQKASTGNHERLFAFSRQPPSFRYNLVLLSESHLLVLVAVALVAVVVVVSCHRVAGQGIRS